MLLDRLPLDAASFAAGAALVSRQGAVRFRHEPWLKDGLCWAAAAKMVHFSVTGEDLPQCSVATAQVRALHPSVAPIDCCSDLTPCLRAEVTTPQALDQLKHLRDQRTGGLSFDEVKAEIPAGDGAGHPIVCNQRGHVVILFAWREDADGSDVRFSDPRDQGTRGNETWVKFDSTRVKSELWQSTFLTQ